MALTLASCEDFLDRPTEDKATVNDYFTNDAECLSATNDLYSLPWGDLNNDGNMFKIGDYLAGNYYQDFASDVYCNHSVTSGEGQLNNACMSIWQVVAHANTCIIYLEKSSAPIAKQCIGEAMVMKAMAYFWLVRTWGAVPIIHDTQKIVAEGSSFDLYKYREQDVYDYIINTLVEAMNYLPKKNGTDGRIDYYSAEGLLAKVYLQAAASKNGTLNEKCLAKAKEYAQDVIEHSGRQLHDNYYDIFRISTGCRLPENLVTLHFSISPNWNNNNIAHCCFGAQEFFGSQGWGSWGGPSQDLMKLFDVDPLDPESINKSAFAYVKDAQTVEGANYTVVYNNDVDVRRQSTMAMLGDYNQYWFRDFGGYLYNANNAKNVVNGYGAEEKSAGIFNCGTGAQLVKYIQGHDSDHLAESGSHYGISNMCSATPQHLLRLSDIYLVYVEACMNVATSADARSTSDAKALEYFNAVRKRAHAKEFTGSITFQQLMDERRRELAMEGDNWFDFVRQADYDKEGAVARIKSQNRNCYGLDNLRGLWGVPGSAAKTKQELIDGMAVSNVQNIVQDANGKLFRLPFPQNDLAANKHLLDEPSEYSFSDVSYYNSELFNKL